MTTKTRLITKNHVIIYLKDFTDFFYTDIFFVFFDHQNITQMPVYNVGYVKGMRYCEQPTVLLARTYLNLNSISNIFQETHGFLVLKDPVIICIYLRKSQLLWHQQQKFLWLGERPSSHLKVTKIYFGPEIKYLSEAFFADFWCQDGIPCSV